MVGDGPKRTKALCLPSHTPATKRVLAPCPFCGFSSTVRLATWTGGWGCYDREFFTITCRYCETYGPKRTTPKAAQIAWNKRAT